MADVHTIEQRHANMAAIKGKNTKPEIIVRKWLWNEGFRYRINDKRLPGKPDIVLPKYKVAIFVNGCFWHGHEGCKYYVVPKSNTDFWLNKISRNTERDKENILRLTMQGWLVWTIWECQLKPQKRMETLLSSSYQLSRRFLDLHKKVKIYEMNEGAPLMVAEEGV